MTCNTEKCVVMEGGGCTDLCKEHRPEPTFREVYELVVLLVNKEYEYNLTENEESFLSLFNDSCIVNEIIEAYYKAKKT